jgi:hypothetical protein
MNAIDKIYNPYDFSSTRCYVFIIEPVGNALLKIEHKLPSYIKTIRGIYVTNTYRTLSLQQKNHVGILSLNFNGNAFKSFHLPLPNTNIQPEVSNPLELYERIEPNSYLQGYFYGLKSLLNPYRISIYLHYDYERK